MLYLQATYTFIKHGHIMQNIYLELAGKSKQRNEKKKRKEKNQNYYITTAKQTKPISFKYGTREEKVVMVTIAFSPMLVELQFPLIFGKRVESQNF